MYHPDSESQGRISECLSVAICITYPFQKIHLNQRFFKWKNHKQRIIIRKKAKVEKVGIGGNKVRRYEK